MDEEWGIPVHDDKKLFEMLVLESFQAGLSWATILKRRSGFKKAFANWNLKKVAAFDENDVERLMGDAGIIRNRLKITATINNAKLIIGLKSEFGSFDSYLWSFVDGKPITRNKKSKSWSDLPAESPESKALSKDLKKRGFSFVGSTCIYAFMQAVGMVDDRIF
ncbi:MAG: DNA-3-methyladenine glycosylase I [Planctomycetes bacterium]|nr:DNA-3-methyladenine glycosylase I [Planctomycetota bacterium]